MNQTIRKFDLLATMLIGMVVLTPVLKGQESVDSQDQQAFRDAANFPWFDFEEGAIQPTKEPTTSPEGSRHRGSKWVRIDRRQSRNVSNWDWPSINLSLLVNVLFWCLVATVFLILVAFLIWALMRQNSLRQSRSKLKFELETGTDAARIENLPIDTINPNTDLLAAAQNAYQQGDFRKAVVYLYGYMLVQLDKNSWIHLAKGKTNRQYLMEVRREKSLFRPVERVMVAFEDVFFGDLDLTRSEIEGCWKSLDEFQQNVIRQEI